MPFFLGLLVCLVADTIPIVTVFTWLNTAQLNCRLTSNNYKDFAKLEENNQFSLLHSFKIASVWGSLDLWGLTFDILSQGT